MNIFTNTTLVLLHGLAEEKEHIFRKCFLPVCEVEYKHGEYTLKKKSTNNAKINFNISSQTLKGK